MDLWIQFNSIGSLYAPVPGLLVYPCIDVELGEEVLDISLILYRYKASLEVFGEVQLLFAISLACWLSSSSASW